MEEAAKNDADTPHPRLLLGPLLRYVGPTEATIWVETDRACEVEVLGTTARTFGVAGHSYALVHVTGLEPDSVHEYRVRLDGRVVWPPEQGWDWPAPVVRTPAPDERLTLAFGSCRVAVPHEPPYTLSADAHPDGMERDALVALAQRAARSEPRDRPDLLVLLGDQVYADMGSPRARSAFRDRRDTDQPPGLEATDFEEYTRLYWESWQDPPIRWLFSTIPSAMIFDDHEVHDDWNTSGKWMADMERKPWWRERLVGGYMTYWIYQHLGNLTPSDLEQNSTWQAVRSGDAEGALRRLGEDSASSTDGSRWSYRRDLGPARLVVMDSRAGRDFSGGRRRMVDDQEWAWIVEQAEGGVDHLLLATSLPAFLAPGMQDLERWNEAVAGGVWGRLAARAGESLRRAMDLEHWGAFTESWLALIDLVRSVGAGERGTPPATIVLLSGDVHHAYLAPIAFRVSDRVRSRVYQATCSPVRNPLRRREQRAVRFGASRAGAAIGRALARSARLPRPPVRWRFDGPPVFDNQIATLDIEGREARLTIERTDPHPEPAGLTATLRRRLA